MNQFFKQLKIYFNLFSILFADYKWHIALIIVLGILSGLFGGLSVGLLIPLISFAIKGGEVGSDFISRATVNIFEFFHVDPSITAFLALIVLLFSVKAVILFFFGLIINRVALNYETNTMRRLYLSTLQADWPYLSRHKVGYLNNILMSNLKFVNKLMFSFSNFFLNSINSLIYLAIALKLSWEVSISTIGFGLFLVVASQPLVRRTRRYSRQQNTLYHEIGHEVNENVSGLKTIKALGSETSLASAGFKFFEKWQRNKMRLFLLAKLNTLAIEPLSIIFIAAVFLILFNRADFDLAIFAVIVYLIQKIFSYIEGVRSAMYASAFALPFILNIVNFDKEINKAGEALESGLVFGFKDKLEFKNVSFSYGPGQEGVENLNFEVRRGEFLGIIGPSGSGKTTLTDLLLRLLKPGNGEILIDGQNIGSVSIGDWRRAVGYVSQDVFLKNDTIRNNIKFYNDSIKDEDIMEGAKRAYIYDFIQSLPEGFNTMVGERGVRLSGGEKQRVALARILARQPQILVLDEATSSLDSESEAIIHKAIAELRGRITVISIAHRISTVKNSDRLLILEKGEIVESGKPEDLLKDKNSYFYKIANINV